MTGSYPTVWRVEQVANYNLEALPWKCFLDSQPTYRDLWFPPSPHQWSWKDCNLIGNSENCAS